MFENYNWFFYKMKHMFSYIFTQSAPRPMQYISCNAHEDSTHFGGSFDSPMAPIYNGIGAIICTHLYRENQCRRYAGVLRYIYCYCLFETDIIEYRRVYYLYQREYAALWQTLSGIQNINVWKRRFFILTVYSKNCKSKVNTKYCHILHL